LSWAIWPETRCAGILGAAGLHNENLLRVMPVLQQRVQKSRLRIGNCGRGQRSSEGQRAKVAAGGYSGAKSCRGGTWEKGGHSANLVTGPMKA